MAEQTTTQTQPGAGAGQAAQPSPAAAPASQTSVPTTPPQPSSASAAADGGLVRPEGLPDQFWDPKAGGLKLKDLLTEREALAKVKEEHDAAIAARPKAAEEYKPILPEGVTLPDNIEVNTKDPLFIAAQKAAFDTGASQETFSKFVAAYAQTEIAKAQAIKDAVKARDDALGPHGPARVEALHKWADTFFDADTARDFKAAVVTPKQIAALEKIQAVLTAQGTVPFNAAHREGTPDPNALPQGYEKWSPVDKRNYQLAKARQDSASARH